MESVMTKISGAYHSILLITNDEKGLYGDMAGKHDNTAIIRK